MKELGEIISLEIKDLGIINYLMWKIDPKSKILKVVGPNDSGKSTVLDGIKYALEGTAAIPEDSINHDSKDKKAVINIKTDRGYKITRKIRKSKTNEQIEELEVTLDGAPVAAAQTFLSSLSAKFPDPQDLADLSSQDLYRKLYSLIEPELAVHQKALDTSKTEATVIRKTIKNLGARPIPPENVSTETIPFAEASDLYNAALRAHTAAKERADQQTQKLEGIKKSITEKKERIEILRAEVESLEFELSGLESRVETGTPIVANIVAEALSAKAALDAAEATYNAAKENQQNSEIIAAIRRWDEANDQQQAQLNAELAIQEECTKKMEKILADYNFPIPGLTLDAETNNVLIDGVPWDRLSTSTKLVAAARLAASSIPDNGLKVLYVHRGESIGAEKMKALAEFAAENNVKIFMEVMSEQPVNPEPGIVHIVHGTVQSGAESEAPGRKEPERKAVAVERAQTTVAAPALWGTTPAIDEDTLF